MSLLHVAVFIPFIFSAGLLASRKLLEQLHRGWLTLPVPLMLFVFFLWHMPQIQETPIIHSMSWLPSLGINMTLYLDGLSLLFSLLISGIGLLVVLYSIFYLEEEKEAQRRFYAYLLMFMGAMLGVVLSDNLFVLYGFWELTSIASFLLIAFWFQRDRSQYGALKSMLITVFGGLAMFAGFILLYVMTDTFSVREIIAQVDVIKDHSLMVPALILVLLGAFTKSAQFPFHIWLPDAMEAPTPVSSYLHSATMVKAGLYLVARLSPVFAMRSEWFWIVSIGGLVTLLYGSLKAVRQTDLKALLAYSTISQLGLIMCLLGLGSAAGLQTETAVSLFFAQATAAALFHLVNHAVFKGALFMVVGIVDHETGTRDLRKLGGLISFMPVTFSIAVIGAFSMAGLPPFGGFLSKEMFFTSVLNIREMNMWSLESWGVLIPVVAWIASVFTFMYSMVLLVRTFGGKHQPELLPKKPHEAPVGLLISPTILAGLALAIGLFPALPTAWLVEPAMNAIHPSVLAAGEQFDIYIRMWHGWTTELFMTIALIVLGAILVYVYKMRGWKLPGSGEKARFTLNRLYDKTLQGSEYASEKLTSLYMTGSIRRYLIYIFLFFVIALGTTMLRLPVFNLDFSANAPVTGYEIAAVIVLALAALAVPFSQNRMASILLTGAVGYMVTLLFVLFRAPDLALTQLIVETVSVVLFLLCFKHLPKLKKEAVKIPFKLTNAIIAAAVGVVVTFIALGVGSNKEFTPISTFFMEESYNLAGGKNMVNVILVDFRGFDTMLEVIVLGIASLGIYAMATLRLGDQAKQPLNGNHLSNLALRREPKTNDVILMTTARVVIFIIVLFSINLFFAGHNAPGGGFIGGLLTAAAIILFVISFGMDAVGRVLPFNYRIMTGIGLLIAVLTGVGAFLFNAPFLSHSFDYFTLPILGETELATAVIFDLGVYLAVIGVTLTIILTVGRER